MIGVKRKGRFETAPKTKRVVGQEVSLPWEIAEKIIGYAIDEFATKKRGFGYGEYVASDNGVLYVDRDLCNRFLQIFAMFQNSVMHNKYLFYYVRALIWRKIYEYHPTTYCQNIIVVNGLLPAGFMHEISVTPCFVRDLEGVEFFGHSSPCDAARLLMLPRVNYVVCQNTRHFLYLIGQLPTFATGLAMDYLGLLDLDPAYRLNAEEKKYWTPERFSTIFPNFRHRIPVLRDHYSLGMTINDIWGEAPALMFLTYEKVAKRLLEFSHQNLAVGAWHRFNEQHAKEPYESEADVYPMFGDIVRDMDFARWHRARNPIVANYMIRVWHEWISRPLFWGNSDNSDNDDSDSEEW